MAFGISTQDLGVEDEINNKRYVFAVWQNSQYHEPKMIHNSNFNEGKPYGDICWQKNEEIEIVVNKWEGKMCLIHEG